MVELINVFFQTFYLIVILIWLHFNLEKSLINLILIFGVINFIVSVIATFVFFKIQEHAQKHIKGTAH